jgi:TolA-binding protein
MKSLFCLVFALAVILAAAPLLAQDPEQPAEPQEPQGETVTWESNLDAAVEKAKESGKVIMVYFYIQGSDMCNAFEQYCINQPDVVELSKNFLCLKVEKNKEADVAKHFSITSAPHTLFISAEQRMLGRIKGYLEPKPFAKKVKEIYESVDAEKKALETLSEDSEDLKAQLELAKALVIRDDRDRAIAGFKKVIDGDPRNEKGLLVEACFRLGYLQAENSMFEEAGKNFEKVKKFDTLDKSGYGDDMLLVEAVMDMDNPNGPKIEDALKKLRQFLVKYDKSDLMPQALFRLGYAYYLKNDNAKAVETWEQLVEKYPDTGEAEQVKWMIPQLKEQEKKK